MFVRSKGILADLRAMRERQPSACSAVTYYTHQNSTLPSLRNCCAARTHPSPHPLLSGRQQTLLKKRLIPTRSLAAASALTLHDGWGLWATIATAASLSRVLENQTRVGQLLSAPLLAILFGLLLSALNIIPGSCASYDNISSYLLPLAAALYLLESDLRKLSATERSTVAAFMLATLGTIGGTVVAWLSIGRLLGPEGWKVAAALAASYVGGSVNFAAVSTALGMPAGSLLASAMSADMIAMAGYLALIGWWPVSSEAVQQMARKHSASTTATQSASGDTLGMSIAAAAVACALGSQLAQALGIPGFSLGLVAIAASCFASLGAAKSRSRASAFAGAEALGSALMSFFFVTIGAAAGSLSAVLRTGWLLAFISIQLAVHLAVTMGGGALLGLPTQALLTASNAAIGGPGTAAAMATSRKWPALVRPALIIGAFGYSIGTTLGVCVGHLLRIL